MFHGLPIFGQRDILLLCTPARPERKKDSSVPHGLVERARERVCMCMYVCMHVLRSSPWPTENRRRSRSGNRQTGEREDGKSRDSDRFLFLSLLPSCMIMINHAKTRPVGGRYKRNVLRLVPHGRTAIFLSSQNCFKKQASSNLGKYRHLCHSQLYGIGNR